MGRFVEGCWKENADSESKQSDVNLITFGLEQGINHSSKAMSIIGTESVHQCPSNCVET